MWQRILAKRPGASGGRASCPPQRRARCTPSGAPRHPATKNCRTPAGSHPRHALACGPFATGVGLLVLRDDVDYQDLGVRHFDKIQTERQTRHLVKRLQQLGCEVNLNQARRRVIIYGTAQRLQRRVQATEGTEDTERKNRVCLWFILNSLRSLRFIPDFSADPARQSLFFPQVAVAELRSLSRMPIAAASDRNRAVDLFLFHKPRVVLHLSAPFLRYSGFDIRHS
jgi:hypothetical protein